jgi:hypothetical protein
LQEIMALFSSEVDTATVVVTDGDEAAEVIIMVGLADEDITTGGLADAIADGTNL